jgi:hypothetical protein
MTRREFILLAGTANSISMYRNRVRGREVLRAPVRGKAGLPQRRQRASSRVTPRARRSLVSCGVTV